MINTRFEKHKIKREIKMNGTQYEFFRMVKNEFGELTENPVSVGILKGIYHEQNSYISETINSETISRQRKIPCILCLFEDLQKLRLQVDDYFSVTNYMGFGDRRFYLKGITDVQNWNEIADISFEQEDIPEIEDFIPPDDEYNPDEEITE